MIGFDSVKKWYGSFLALDIHRLSLENGLYWLQGGNGSGKTSFLKMIAGLHPFEGKIELDGDTLKKDRVAYLRRVNYAEAEPLYPAFLTAHDMVGFYCRAKKTDPKQVLASLEQLQILHAYKQPLGTYSSGMLKKLSIALAFTGQPEWILLDEPFTTVDLTSVEVICGMIDRSHREKGTSFIITSHQPLRNEQLHLTHTLLAENKMISFIHA
jgi:ABC-2 type transport system ATP-binding protein